MSDLTTGKIKVGISSCLLGEHVRYDGDHRKNSYITDVLADYFEFFPFCPEVSIGLGVPRETIRLELINDEVRCLGSETANLDVTEQLYSAADNEKNWHQNLCGYIFKRSSPSCGIEHVKLLVNDTETRDGIGLYAQRLMQNFPYLPVEDEGRLEDPLLRENFIQRVYILSRWKRLMAKGISLTSLQQFHDQHKTIFLRHHSEDTNVLDTLISSSSNIDDIAANYLTTMMKLLKKLSHSSNTIT
jgi:uncharacterized protein YbbK (DUF523 family)